MRTLWRLLAGIFKWTWRVLNFIRQLALNVVFLVLVLACVGIWAQFSSNTTEHTTRGALLMDITGVVVDKPSTSSKLGVITVNCLAPARIAYRKTRCLILCRQFARRKTTAISPASCWI